MSTDALLRPKRQNKNIVLLSIAFILFALLLVIPSPAFFTREAWKVIAICVFMIFTMVSGYVPLWMCGILPPVLCALANVPKELVNPFKTYSDGPVWMCIGIFLFAAGVQKQNFHKRIALIIMNAIGTNTHTLVFAVMATTGVISAFMSNNVALAIVMPTAMALVYQIEGSNPDDPHIQYGNFGKAVCYGLLAGATLGGMSTKMGTTSNIYFASAVKDYVGVDVSFFQFMEVGLLFSAILIPVCWFLTTRFIFKVEKKPIDRQMLRDELASLGPWKTAEKMIAVIFIVSVLAFMFNDQLNAIFPTLSDVEICIFMGAVMFFLPCGKGEFILDAPAALKYVPFQQILIIATSRFLAYALNCVQFGQWVSGGLGFLNALPDVFVVVLFTLLVSILTEFMNNSTVNSIFLPIAYAVAIACGINPIMLMFCCCFGCGFAFCLPSASPVNALAVGLGPINTSDMAKCGIVFKGICIILMPIILYLLAAPISPLF